MPHAVSQRMFGMVRYLARGRWRGGWQLPVKLSRAEMKTGRDEREENIFLVRAKIQPGVGSRLTRTIKPRSRQFPRNSFNSGCRFPHYRGIIKRKCPDSRVWFLGRIPQQTPSSKRKSNDIFDNVWH